jgi:CHASE2 domain-containing sensor protein
MKGYPMNRDGWLLIVRTSLIQLGKMTTLALFFWAIHHYLENRATGEHLVAFEQALLQEALGLSPKEPEFDYKGKKLPIVVDISRIHPDKSQAVNREDLDAVVEAVSGAAPAGIGIDLDFSNPSGAPNGGPRPEDMSYFAKWLGKTNVRVGVWHRAAYGRQDWLGVADFANVAAGIALPAEDSQHAFLYSKAGDRDMLIQMPAALWVLGRNRWWQGKEETDYRTLDDLCNQVKHEKRNGEIEFGKYVIDYSYVKYIRNEAVKFEKPQELKNLYVQERLRDRQVLIGDLEDPKDHTCRYGAAEPVSGVLVHATSLATLNNGLFLEVGTWQGVKFKFVVLILAWAVMLGMQIKQQRTGSRESWDHLYVEILMFGPIALMTCLFSTWMIRSQRIFWPDFLWVSLTLLLHPFLTEPFFRIAFRTIPSVFRTIFETFAGKERKDHVGK